ncbi:hypothetical protein KPL71_023551 [Citrus sinensis]|uniref:Uncharacterized protein n=1 Tax=Citrus sinensis TaxID=2711 RepID=A0ACB8IK15_CITSI|nr:hypothetical protein KPL71_023551 [Citrus sinensis]
MARNGERVGEISQPPPQPQPPPPPARASSGGRLRNRADPLLVVCRCFSVLTSLTALLCLAVNVLSAIRSFKNGSDVRQTLVSVVHYCFAILDQSSSCGLGVLVFVNLIVVGIGVLGCPGVAVMTRAFPDYSAKQKDLILLQNIASYMLLACGVVYVISGILCIGCIKRARQQKEMTRDQAVKDLEDLEQRREELEQLLVAERV